MIIHRRRAFQKIGDTMNNGFIMLWGSLCVMLALISSPAHGVEPSAPDTSTQATPHQPTLEEVSAKLDNPISDLWMLWMQHDYMSFSGDLFSGSHSIDVTYFEPVLSIPIGNKWNLVNRPVFTYIDAEVPQLSLPSNIGSIAGGNFNGDMDKLAREALKNADWERRSGFGDMDFLSMVSPKDFPKVGNGTLAWGVGATTMFPTASRDYFGSGKFSAGPAALALYMGEKWKFGALAQQWWSFAGDGNRADVNKMNIQYFWFYSLPNMWQIGAAPNITANWNADSKNRWSIPLGVGVNKTVMIGRLPVRFVLEYHRSIMKPDAYGEDWGVRFVVIPVIPNLIEMAQGKLKLP
jgi:hypothetical protein